MRYEVCCGDPQDCVCGKVYELLTQDGKTVEVPKHVYAQWPEDYRREYKREDCYVSGLTG